MARLVLYGSVQCLSLYQVVGCKTGEVKAKFCAHSSFDSLNLGRVPSLWGYRVGEDMCVFVAFLDREGTL